MRNLLFLFFLFLSFSDLSAVPKGWNTSLEEKLNVFNQKQSQGSEPGIIYTSPNLRFSHYPSQNKEQKFFNVHNGNELRFGENSILRTSTLTLNGGANYYLYPNAMPANVVLITNPNSNITFTSSGSHSAHIRGTGKLVIQDNVTLLGQNSYSGGTFIEGPSQLIGSTKSIPSAGGVFMDAQATLIFDQSENGVYSGLIQGEKGSLEKRGTHTLTLTAKNTYQGPTRVTKGTLVVQRCVHPNSLTTVEEQGALVSPGRLGTIHNAGQLQVGFNEKDSLHVEGRYVQTGDNCVVKCFVSPESSSVLKVKKSADLKNQGELHPALSPGAYRAQKKYAVIKTQDGIEGLFAQVHARNLGQWKMSTVNRALFVTNETPVVLTPFPIQKLPHNARNVGEYFFDNPLVTFASSDLTAVANASLALTSEESFAESLLRLSPLTETALTSTDFQNNIQMAIVLDHQFQSSARDYRQKARRERERNKQRKKEEAIFAKPHTGIFIQPIGLFYNQRQTASTLASSRQVPFWAYTYGAGIGYEHVLNERFIFEGGVGYTHSNLSWQENFGNSKWSSIYVAPFFGWVSRQGFANFMVMGAFNFYNTHRKIVFTGIERVAKSRYNSYDILLRGNGGMRFYLNEGLWFQPEGTLNYLNIFTMGYQESEAGGVSLDVKSHTSMILQPSLRLKLIEEFLTPKFCFAPNLYVGWLANIPIDSGNITARFIEAPSRLFFNVQGERVTTNQLVLGGEFFIRRYDQFEMTSCFEADILSQFEIYSVRLKLQWLF